MTKNDIVHLLAEKRGYRRCLVLRTALTGPDCNVDPKRFDVYTEIKYECEGTPGKGIPRDNIAFGHSFDVALLDPWHTYEASLRDLQTAFNLLPSGGALVCHDCWPHKEETTHPDGWHACLEGKEWSGQTFRAWADFVNGRSDLRHCTVDVDYGVGIAIKEPSAVRSISFWKSVDYPKLNTPAGQLFLNLCTVPEFIAWSA